MQKPATVFKYQPPTKQAIDNLRTSSIYFGKPHGFNDPFDCALTLRVAACVDQQERLRLAILKSAESEGVAEAKGRDDAVRSIAHVAALEAHRMVKSIVERNVVEEVNRFLTTAGVTCFSQRETSLLMWSHYSDHHRGFVLGFDTRFAPFSFVRKVKYVRDVPELKVVYSLKSPNQISWRSGMKRMFCVKSTDWSYEKEWRVFHEKGGETVQYEPEALTGVYFGERASQQDIDLICSICRSQFPNIKFWKGKRSKTEFAIEFEELPRD